jgi:ubiquinone/menaquinone biosynthesis C-methylase UbiE
MEAERTELLYSRLSSHYDLLFDKVFQPGREAALAAMELREGERVLEIGVGTGLVLPLYPRNVEVIGIDLSEGMLEEARYRIVQLGLRHASVLRMDAGDLHFEDGTFDAILAPYVMSVVTDPVRVLSEMRRVCRPGGRIVIVNHFRAAPDQGGVRESADAAVGPRGVPARHAPGVGPERSRPRPRDEPPGQPVRELDAPEAPEARSPRDGVY